MVPPQLSSSLKLDVTALPLNRGSPPPAGTKPPFGLTMAAKFNTSPCEPTLPDQPNESYPSKVSGVPKTGPKSQYSDTIPLPKRTISDMLAVVGSNSKVPVIVSLTSPTPFGPGPEPPATMLIVIGTESAIAG